MSGNMAGLTDRIKAEARELGFDLVGVAPVRPSEFGEFYRDWIAHGRHGSMDYLAREDAVLRRLTPEPQFRSAVVVGLNYYVEGAGADADAGAGEGIIARYANGRDYHKVIKPRLMSLLRFVEVETGREMPLARAFVDTGPVLERELARRAGIGWFGRNTMMIHPKRGSYFFLGTLLLDVELDYDAPFVEDHCGTCSACISACPTGALLGRDANGAPVMDAAKCISYLTIENRGPIPLELRSSMGNRIFGCDICQEVCPWNSPKFVQLTGEKDFLQGGERGVRADLIQMMSMDENAWDVYTRGSPIRRAKRSGLLRNVAVALGNARSPAAVPVLVNALRDLEPLIRGHAAWALGQIGGEEATDALRDALTLECDAWVMDEMMGALGLRSELG